MCKHAWPCVPLPSQAEGREANLLDLGAQLMYDLATFGTKDVEKPKYPELTYNVGQVCRVRFDTMRLLFRVPSRAHTIWPKEQNFYAHYSHPPPRRTCTSTSAAGMCSSRT